MGGERVLAVLEGVEVNGCTGVLIWGGQILSRRQVMTQMNRQAKSTAIIKAR